MPTPRIAFRIKCRFSRVSAHGERYNPFEDAPIRPFHGAASEPASLGFTLGGAGFVSLGSAV